MRVADEARKEVPRLPEVHIAKKRLTEKRRRMWLWGYGEDE
jgi:hypothetical protein